MCDDFVQFFTGQRFVVGFIKFRCWIYKISRELIFNFVFVDNVFQLYLIRSVFSQLLVVARTDDNKYFTIPLTSQLKFHLLSDSHQKWTR
jgi:hypothetical protein